MAFLPWIEPPGGVLHHPRILVSPAELAALRANCTGQLSAIYSSLRTYANSKLTEVESWFDVSGHSEAEYTGCFPFVYLIEGSTQADAFAAKARDIAMWFAAQAYPDDTHKRRRRALAMALVFTWCYEKLSVGERTSIRNAIWRYVQGMNVRTSEYLWGHSHGYMTYAVTALTAILGEGTPAENAAYRARMEMYMDAWDNGTDHGLLPPFRWFGVDGGTHKSMYLNSSEQFYMWTFPTVVRTLGLNWWTTERWWTDSMLWNLWNFRGDRTLHRLEGETVNQFRWTTPTSAHALQIANRENNAFGRACQWLYNDIQALKDTYLHGPFQIHACVWMDPARQAVRPTTSSMGGCMKVFTRSGRACVRNGWDPAIHTSFVTKFPNFYTAGHQRTADGGFELCFRNVPLIRDSGIYDPNITVTYKDPTQPISQNMTGHRYCYARRSCATSTMRIFDSNEPAEARKTCFQLRDDADTTFGVIAGGVVTPSNIGDQLYPKIGAKSEPVDLWDLLNEVGWAYNGLLETPVEQPLFCYIPEQLTGRFRSNKCTKAHRHFLWINEAAIPGWVYPIIMVFDDLTIHSDPKAEKTYRYTLQTAVDPVGTAASFSVTVGNARFHHRVLKPSVAMTTITGFVDDDGVDYPIASESAADDVHNDGSNAKRIEINPAVSATSIELLALIFPCPSTVAAPPTVTLIDDATWIGATIGGVDCKIRRGPPYEAQVGDPAPNDPPDAPTGLTGDPGNRRAELDWEDNSEGDLDHYELWRRHQL